MYKRSENILSRVLLAGILFFFAATPLLADTNPDPRLCNVTVMNNTDEYMVFLADRVNYGVVYPKRWNTFSLLKVNYQSQPYHFEIQVDVNKNGNPVTVKEEYVDLSNRNEYRVDYP